MAIVFLVLTGQGSLQQQSVAGKTSIASNDDNLYLRASMFGVLVAIPYSIISAQKILKQNIFFAVVLCWRYH